MSDFAQFHEHFARVGSVRLAFNAERHVAPLGDPQGSAGCRGLRGLHRERPLSNVSPCDLSWLLMLLALVMLVEGYIGRYR